MKRILQWWNAQDEGERGLLVIYVGGGTMGLIFLWIFGMIFGK